MDMNEKTLKDIVSRLEKLENAVFRTPKPKVPKSRGADSHQGASGGVKLLIESNYFSKKHTAADTQAALQDKDYHYPRAVVQVALYRLSKKGGPLVAFEDKGVKVYVKRK